MDETLIGWVFLFMMLVWRGITTLDCVQRLLHRCGCLAFFLQWYTLTFIGLTLLLARTFFDIVIYDYIGYHFLSPDRIEQNIQRICSGLKLSDEDCGNLRKDLLIPNWLRKTSLVAPVCGVLAFVLLAAMLGKFIQYNHYKKSRRDADKDWRMMPWKLGLRLEWVIIIIGTPLVFIVMAMRSLIRVWAVMTGSCYKPGENWAEVQQLEMATYTMDLELAYTFQFYAIWKFGLLCSSLLEHSKYIRATSESDQQTVRHYKRTLAKTSIQGVYAFFIIGLLRSAFDFGIAYFQEKPETKGMADVLQEKALGKVGTIFAFVTIMCMINMVLVSKVKDISDNLGNANLKFLGTRLLLLIAQIQPQVLSLLVAGSPLYKIVKDNASKFHLEERLHIDLDRWTFTKYQSSLAHVAFLNIEGLVVVLVTMIFWRLTSNQRAVLLDEKAREGSWFLCGKEVGARESASPSIFPQDCCREDGEEENTVGKGGGYLPLHGAA